MAALSLSTKSNHTGLAYNMAYWGDGYFNVDQTGRVYVRPYGESSKPMLLLVELIEELQKRHLSLPILVRFANILHDRMKRLQLAFHQAMRKQAYSGDYISVYPIKVNQQRQVISELLRANECVDLPGQIGLEAGSRPELLAVLGLSEPGKSVIVCNGYKDQRYIRQALLGQQLGHRIYIIIERLAEVSLILQEARVLGVVPQLGIRVRLNAIAHGRWQNSGGEKSKFGLSARQVLLAVRQLQDENYLTSLVLLHCHMGSQIANIRDIQQGMLELARYYTELYQLGAPIDIIDIGGGLGVDYTGMRTRDAYSINYSLQEYANNIVMILKEACVRAVLPEPTIISETGRAMVAHHAVLITNIIDVEQADQTLVSAGTDLPMALQHLQITPQSFSKKSTQEIYHDIQHWMSEVKTLYTHGNLSLKQLAMAEQLYLRACQLIKQRLDPNLRNHQSMLDELSDKLADKLFINASIFQSIPDVWGIGQLFPVVPLTGLNQPLSRRGHLHDITCDSDGCLTDYVTEDEISSSLPLYEFNPDNPPLLGIFLVGAYQEILGDMHNLFGDTHAVNVTIDSEGSYQISEPEWGDTVSDVLRYVHLDIDALIRQYEKQLATNTILTRQEKLALLTEFKNELASYTYLEA